MDRAIQARAASLIEDRIAVRGQDLDLGREILGVRAAVIRRAPVNAPRVVDDYQTQFLAGPGGRRQIEPAPARLAVGIALDDRDGLGHVYRRQEGVDGGQAPRLPAVDEAEGPHALCVDCVTDRPGRRDRQNLVFRRVTIQANLRRTPAETVQAGSLVRSSIAHRRDAGLGGFRVPRNPRPKTGLEPRRSALPASRRWRWPLES